MASSSRPPQELLAAGRAVLSGIGVLWHDAEAIQADVDRVKDAIATALAPAVQTVTILAG